MRIILLAGLALLAGLSTASAQTTVDSRCTTMKDPIGCTCALATGGTIANGSWARARGGDTATYNTCIAERGGKAQHKPTTIPGRL